MGGVHPCQPGFYSILYATYAVMIIEYFHDYTYQL